MIEFNGKNVGTWCTARVEMELDRAVCRALRSGTAGMRAMGTVFLPMDFRERAKPDQYVSRVLLTTLFPAYDDAVKDLGAKPFQRNVVLKGAERLPEGLADIEQNADLQGTNLTTFGRSLLTKYWDAGAVHILVDKPGNQVAGQPAEDGTVTTRPMTVAEERANNVRPYFCIVTADNLIGWTHRLENGVRKLESIRIYSEREEWTAEGPKVVQQVRVWTETAWQVWERDAVNIAAKRTNGILTASDLLGEVSRAQKISMASEEKQYTLVSSGANPLGVVPLVSRNIEHSEADPLRADPPLRGLAWKNVEDWQIASSEANNLHWHSYPVLWGSGMPNDYVDQTKTIVYGAGAAILSTDSSMRVGLMETNGAAAKGLADKRATLREEMNALGQQPFLEARASGSATGVAVDENRSQTRAQCAAEDIEWLLFEAYRMAARWQSPATNPAELLPEDFDVEVWRDFSAVANAQANLQTLDTARARGDLSRETYLRQLQRYGVLDTDADIEEELQRIEDEGPAMGDVLPFPPQPGQPPADPAQDPNAEPERSGAVAR